MRRLWRQHAFGKRRRSWARAWHVGMTQVFLHIPSIVSSSSSSSSSSASSSASSLLQSQALRPRIFQGWGEMEQMMDQGRGKMTRTFLFCHFKSDSLLHQLNKQELEGHGRILSNRVLYNMPALLTSRTVPCLSVEIIWGVTRLKWREYFI